MSNLTCLRVTLLITILLAITWPAYLTSRFDADREQLIQALHAGKGVRARSECPAPKPEAKAFRLGISPEDPPFSRRSAPP